VTLSATLNVNIDVHRWIQASLPVRWCGQGIRSAVLLAPSAYLASAAITTELTSSLLPVRLRDAVDSGIATATSAWLRQANSLLNPTAAVPTPISMTQRCWDDRVVRYRPTCYSTLPLLTPTVRVCWLRVHPGLVTGLKLCRCRVSETRWTTLLSRIPAGLRLGAPIVRSHVFVCGKTVTVDGHHGLSCRFGYGRHSRHNQINDVLCRAFIMSGTLATREPYSLCTVVNDRTE